jgi:two-component system response regulator HydG
VRELKNVMESLAVFHRQGEEIGATELAPEVRAASGVAAVPEPPPVSHGAGGVEPKPAPVTMADVERETILAALAKTGGRRAEAARLLDIGLRTLQRKLKEYKEQGLFEG